MFCRSVIVEQWILIGPRKSKQLPCQLSNHLKAQISRTSEDFFVSSSTPSSLLGLATHSEQKTIRYDLSCSPCIFVKNAYLNWPYRRIGPSFTWYTTLAASSLGRKALCVSEQAVETREKQLSQCTIAIAFLGTPHRGSGLAPFATGVAHILKVAQKRINKDLIALLHRNSEALADIEASFGIGNRNGEITLRAAIEFW